MDSNDKQHRLLIEDPSIWQRSIARCGEPRTLLSACVEISDAGVLRINRTRRFYCFDDRSAALHFMLLRQ